MQFLSQLEDILESRKQGDANTSYVADLFQQGVDRISRKIGEEAAECIVAAKNNDREELCNEAADLLFHLMVLLKQQGTSLEDVVQVLSDRHAK